VIKCLSVSPFALCLILSSFNLLNPNSDSEGKKG
jgi:hypothetical protein